MKKQFLIGSIVLTCLMTAWGCGKEPANDTTAAKTDLSVEVVRQSGREKTEDKAVEKTVADTEVPGINDTGVANAAEFKAPSLEWWDIYNPNGFDTFTGVITNPNNVAIDVCYDLVFYKDGAEVSRIEFCSNYSILPGHRDAIWANYYVPKSVDVDDVRMENVFVTEAAYGAIDGTYEFLGQYDNVAMFEVTLDSRPTMASVWFIFYNDTNKNEQCDKGEIVATDIFSLLEQKGEISFNTDIFPYTDYEVVITAY